MYKNCSVCAQSFSPEPGFYFGAAYVSYGLNIAWLAPAYFILINILALDFVQALLIMGAIGLILFPIIFRLSRSFYIHIFVKYEPDKQVKDIDP